MQIGANTATSIDMASMKALPKRKGNSLPSLPLLPPKSASMKALPKRKGNFHAR